ncbi:NUDIX domain-containing protein [Streptomyces vinaceus]|uniref:NUDIX domain-containing protein n=1 Tax=Streptomyces vinaceus TaxID=1960 RepID=UPI0036837D91
MTDQMTLEAAVADAHLAVREYDEALAWLDRACQAPMAPLSAEVWVTDPSFTHVLLVKHRVRGWVPPGGKVETDETPRQAAVRELREETGLRGELLPLPAAVAVRSYRADWSATLGLSYAAVLDREASLCGESGQPPRWFDLDKEWESMFPADRDRIRAHVRLLAEGRPIATR